MDRQEEPFQKFQASGQEPVRLRIALEEYVRRDNLPEPVRQEYRRYLKKRRRPAAEALARVGDLLGLKRLWADGILEPGDRAYCLEKAQEAGDAENRGLAAGAAARAAPEGSRTAGAGTGHPPGGPKPPAACGFPALALALGALPARPDPTLPACVGTDGRPSGTSRTCCGSSISGTGRRRPGFICICAFHALYLHLLVGKDRNRRCWDAACDWTAEYWVDRWMGPPEQSGQDSRARWFRVLEETGTPVQAEAACRFLSAHPEAEPPVRRLFRRDAHPWQREPEGEPAGARKARCSGGQGEGELPERLRSLARMEETARRWRRLGAQAGTGAGARDRTGRRGTQAGSRQEAVELQKKKAVDYRRFLKRYAVFREELQLDGENFDYLPYLYSQEHYEKLRFLEPLEYAEVHRLEELVIAIDTSGSCSGPVVRRFLEETYQIFQESENFSGGCRWR